MKKNFLIIGLGRFGLAIAEELTKQNIDVLGIDSREEVVQKASDLLEHCLICDATNEQALKSIGLDHIDHAIITIGDSIQSTILSTIILKEMGIKKISVRIDDEYYSKVLRKIGADEIILPEKIAGVRYANSITSDSFIDFFNLSGDFVLVQMKINANYVPTSLLKVDSRNKFDVSIVSICRDNKTFMPKGQDDLLPNDIILVIGKKEKINRFDTFINHIN